MSYWFGMKPETTPFVQKVTELVGEVEDEDNQEMILTMLEVVIKRNKKRRHFRRQIKRLIGKITTMKNGYEVNEIYNCRNEKANGCLILLRESGKKTTDTTWIERVLGIREASAEIKKRDKITWYHNRFVEWIEPLVEQELRNVWFTNFSINTFGEGYRNKESQGYKDYLKEKGQKRVVELLEEMIAVNKERCLKKGKEENTILIYTVWDIYDEFIHYLDLQSDNDGKGFFFHNGKNEPKRHCFFSYKGNEFEMYEVLHPMARGASKYSVKNN